MFLFISTLIVVPIILVGGRILFFKYVRLGDLEAVDTFAVLDLFFCSIAFFGWIYIVARFRIPIEYLWICAEIVIFWGLPAFVGSILWIMAREPEEDKSQRWGLKL